MEMMSPLRLSAFGIRPSGLILIVLLSLSAIACWVIKGKHPATVLFEPQIASLQSAPLCPWREPAEDLKSFFPLSTRYEAETRVLSGLRIPLTSLLGRPPTGDENALHIYRVYEQGTGLGVILTQRVKGRYGAMELVLGVDPAGKVCGIRLQRQREPESIASTLQRAEWLGAFIGKQAGDAWKLGEDIPAVPQEAKISAEAIVQGTRSLLILFQAATEAGGGGANGVGKPHHSA